MTLLSSSAAIFIIILCFAGEVANFCFAGEVPITCFFLSLVRYSSGVGLSTAGRY
jgi:hypothetical protein